MEANRKVFQERENGQPSNTAEISSKMKSEKFLLDLETFRNNWYPGHHRLIPQTNYVAGRNGDSEF